MDRLTWDEIFLTRETSPNVSRNLKDYISMLGALNIPVPRGKPLPEKLYQTTSAIEAVLRSSYPNFRFVGEENVNEIDPRAGCTRYLGQVYGGNGDVEVMVRMTGVESRRDLPLQTYVDFFGVFPVGKYHSETKRALIGIWPHIKGLNRVLFPSNQAPQDKTGEHSIALFRDDKLVAVGSYAIEEMGIQLDLKEPILMMEHGIMI